MCSTRPQHLPVQPASADDGVTDCKTLATCLLPPMCHVACALGWQGAKQGGLSEGAQPANADTDVGALIEELLPASFLQRCVGGFLEMLAENTSAVRAMRACWRNDSMWSGDV